MADRRPRVEDLVAAHLPPRDGQGTVPSGVGPHGPHRRGGRSDPRDGLRTLITGEGRARQSAIFPDRPTHLELPYTQVGMVGPALRSFAGAQPRGWSSTSRTFEVSPCGVKGFARKERPGSRRPWESTASSA
jgi:hypothetical protein